MAEKKNVPEIRFEGFSEPWHWQTIRNVIEDYIEKTVVQNQYPVLTSSQQQGIVLQEEYFADRQVTTNDNIGYFILPLGFFTYRSRSDSTVFVFNRNDCICRGIISYYYPVFKPKDADSDFLLRRLNYGIQDQLAMAAEGTGQKVLAHSKFKDMIILIPKISEQRVIGRFFKSIDTLITSQQEKYEKLQNIKKSMLEKMFPQDGKDVPEIRFKGFKSGWKEYRVSDIANRFDNLRIPVASNMRVSGSTPYYGANGIQDYVDGYTHEGEFVLVAEDGANDIKNYPVQYVNGRIWVNNHAHVIQAKAGKANNRFLAYCINRTNIEGLLVGGGRAKLNAEVLMNIILILPDLGEQIAIGNYLSQLDGLLDYNHQKLNKLKQLKQSLLQKMFV